MKMTINAYLANSKVQSTQKSAQKAGVFFLPGGRHDENKSRALKIENLDLHGLAGGR